MAFLTFKPDFRRSACHALSFVAKLSEALGAHALAHACVCSSDHDQEQLLHLQPVAGQHSVEARLEWRLEWMGRLLNDRFSGAHTKHEVSFHPACQVN